MYIKTPYGEYLKNGDGERLVFEDEEEAKQYLRKCDWSELFIALCTFEEA